jgi:hypothetical protein
MKRFNKYMYLLLGISLTFTSCDLDQYPYSEVAADDFVKDASSVNNLMMGCYSSLHDVMYYEWAMTELRSDNARMYATGSSAADTKLVEQFDQNIVQPANVWMENYWNAAYVSISRANNVISNVDIVDDKTLHDQYLGEALFVRSLDYFNLVRLWGPTFIVTAKTGSAEARTMQRSSEQNVYALIEQDLENIVNNGLLPAAAKYSADNKGRATLEAAKMLLAKVYVTHYQVGDEKYLKAADLLKQVLESESVGNPQSATDLVSYDKIFATNNEMNKEIIFAVRYKSGNMGLGSPFGNLFAPINNGANVIIGKSFGYNTPTDNLLSAYELAGDTIRLNTNIAQKYYNATTKAWVTTGNCRYCKKYTNPVTLEYDGESDWPVMRVGDAALLYAEILNETSGPTQDALRYLNMIHERAGLTAYTLADFPTKYDFRMAVRNERRLELAFENQRWFDLLRWGEAVNTVNAYYKSETMYTGYNYPVKSINDWQLLLPIPTSILNINPNVAQNAGY